ncbi:hypothetical protein OIE67_41455 [Nonomuraea fuscirosea]|uniref:hypothetical protein n=1 Tax=Nonomuraea fuscirosea TaxID=1291556 RepID=UPI002DDBBDB1|nr:hypothetical protein [Nonomuraea fuscirosea]WSA50479.1 hypothetical protein OIE67_41455 [Nonomuraea fuscirosea]
MREYDARHRDSDADGDRFERVHRSSFFRTKISPPERLVSGVEYGFHKASDMSNPGGPRFTGVIVARIGSIVEYDGNTSGIRLVTRHREMTSGGTPVPGAPVFAVMLKEFRG